MGARLVSVNFSTFQIMVIFAAFFVKSTEIKKLNENEKKKFILVFGILIQIKVIVKTCIRLILVK